MIADELKKNGFKKIGNWYMIYEVISVNLFTKEVKSLKDSVTFITYLDNISYKKIVEIKTFIENL